MINQHPITLPPELFAEWLAKAKRLHPGESTGFIAGEVARLAYQAGADQELEECCEAIRDRKWFGDPSYRIAELRAARRRKPPSLKEQALQALSEAVKMADDVPPEGICSDQADIIRHALEQLPE
jgi:hypothetical protein